VAVNGHAQRLDAISRRLTPDPDQPMTLEMTLQAIAEYEANPETPTILGMSIERLNALVEVEIGRLEAELESSGR